MKSTQTEEKASRTRFYDVAQFAFSALVVTISWSIGLVFSLLALVKIIQSPSNQGEWLPPLTMAAGGCTVGILCLPSLYFSFRRIIAKEEKPWPMRALSRWLYPVSITIPFVLMSGVAILRISGMALLLFPVLHILSIALPLWAIVLSATRGLPLGSAQRFWGVLCSSLCLTPVLGLLLEGMAFLLVGTASVIYLSLQPEAMVRLFEFSHALQMREANFEQITEIVQPLLRSPVIVALILLFFSVCVPMIEEGIKPIGVWLLYGRPLSPAAGFALGALSGGGFALVESLALPLDTSNWLALVTTRLGTAVIHVLNGALCGWAFVQLWTRKRYRRALGAYLSAVLIHGLWNASVVMLTLQAILQTGDANQVNSFWNRLSLSASVSLITLVIGGLVCLEVMNKRLRQTMRA